MPYSELTEEIRNQIRRQIDHKEANTRLSSKYVSHFTPEFGTLKLILQTGFKPSYCNESQIWKYEYYELRGIMEFLGDEVELPEDIQIPMVCFCDIPPKLSKSHRKKYGSYGIFLSKEWAISSHISPVLYILKDTPTHSLFHGLFSVAQRLSRRQITDQHVNADISFINDRLNRLMAYLKPYKDDNSLKKFYDEREWRYIPNVDPNDTLTYLKFSSSDLVQIIVETKKQKNEIYELSNSLGYNIKRKQIKIKGLNYKERF